MPIYEYFTMIYFQIMIDVVARIFCMRSQVKDASENTKQTKHKKQAMKMLNNDRVYGEHANERLMYTEMNHEDTSWKTSNGTTTGLGSSEEKCNRPADEQELRTDGP